MNITTVCCDSFLIYLGWECVYTQMAYMRASTYVRARGFSMPYPNLKYVYILLFHSCVCHLSLCLHYMYLYTNAHTQHVHMQMSHA